ncbi:efflux transporter outer membrane subunit [Pelagicoccus sp. SDUM812005]|uniref:efflux transporter outer membrane subunit n=1 Tax=Pelagicoccus sp. SDUM812005 TaxID=3041257 RepID=UPI00281082E5|nr:efflux transporter outer membrane subunit [Pelagicoccus sp. SDUM812005]MDQ8182144.1 efflux transporter outer membrane subunit [Pelagicoccus sp. SDUM812005]
MTKRNKKALPRIFSRSALVLVLGGLSACATTTSILQSQADFDAELPSAWQNATETDASLDTESLSQWWELFGDPQLESLVEDALANNPDIRSALSAIRMARAERGLEQADLWPSLTASASASNAHTKDRVNDSSTDVESYTAGLDASWEIDLFGKQRQYLNAADAELAAAADDYRQVQVSLAAEVAATYLSLCSYEAQLEVVRSSLDTREVTLQIAQWQEQVGEGDALSTQQSIASAEQARSQIPDLEQSIAETRNSLALLTGRTPPSLLDQLELPATFPQAPASIAVGIPAETLRQRPDVRSAENAILAAQSRLDATELSRFPSLKLSGSIGVDALSAEDLIDPQRILSGLVAGLSAPIWNAGSISRTIEIQREALTQSYLDYERSVLAALSEVENALSSIKKRNQQLDTLERASEAAQESVVLAQMQYEAGEVDALTVLDAQRTELSLQQSRIATQAQALAAHVQLYKSLGGGWSVPTSISQL